MGESTTAAEIQAEISRLAQTIKTIAPHHGNPGGWVKLQQVAMAFKGSAQYVPIVQGLVSMPSWNRYFALTGTAIKRTQEGHMFVKDASPPKLSEVAKIADAVRQYAAQLKPVTLTINRISPVAKVGVRFVQALHVSSEDEVVATETPCEFQPRGGGASTHGRIIGQGPDGAVLYVVLDSEVCSSSLPAVLRIDRAFLLVKLTERLKQLNAIPLRMTPVLSPTPDTAVSVASDDSLKVAQMLAELPTPWTRFLWGPPGAGKTYGIGSLVMRLVEQEPNSRTLIVAPSNRAVDVALEQCLKHLGRSERCDMVQQRRILRFGYPRKSSILEQPQLLGPSEVDSLSRVVRQIASKIAKAEREEGHADKVAVLRARLLAAQEEVKNAVRLHVRGCSVVATTSTLGYLSTSPIPDVTWDNVIIDEVTMVTPAMCTFLASLASKRFLLAGDPRQLGPVYEVPQAGANSDGTAYEWMGRDIFAKSGITHGEGEWREIDLQDKRLARITCQRRCADAIWSRVAYLYPDVKNQSDAVRLRGLMQLPPLPNTSVVVLDTSGCGQGAQCSKVNNSWKNLLHADLALQVVRAIIAAAAQPISNAIIAPYRAQVRLLRQRIRQEQRALRTPWNRFEIDAGTVHQFQGSDADVIIFDMVDSAGRPHVGNLLKGDAGLRLVNVAFTRTKGKLVVIANRDWCRLRIDYSVNALLHEMMSVHSKVPAIRVNLAATPDSAHQEESMALDEALRRRGDILEAMEHNYKFSDGQGVLLARAAVALPDLHHAVFIDAAHQSGYGWRACPQQRYQLGSLGWTFSVFTAQEVTQDADACAASVAETLTALRRRTVRKPTSLQNPQAVNY